METVLGCVTGSARACPACLRTSTCGANPVNCCCSASQLQYAAVGVFLGSPCRDSYGLRLQTTSNLRSWFRVYQLFGEEVERVLAPAAVKPTSPLPVKAAEDGEAAGACRVPPALLRTGFLLNLMPVCT